MGVILLIIVCVFVICAIASGGIWLGYKDQPFKHYLRWGLFWFGVFAVGLSGLVATVTPLVYKTVTANFGSFYEYNKDHYERTAELLREGVPVQFSDSAWFDTANLQQIKSFGESLTEMRDKIVDYNKGLYHYRVWQGSFWDGLFRPNIPENITFIEVSQ